MAAVEAASAAAPDLDPSTTPDIHEETASQAGENESGSDHGEKPVRQQLERASIAKRAEPGSTDDPENADQDEKQQARSPLSKTCQLKTSSATNDTEPKSADNNTNSGTNLASTSSPLDSKHPANSPIAEPVLTARQILKPDRPATSASTERSPSPSQASPLHSPRRKRSRDDLDSDSHRGQKIAATDEARARRSLDEERPDIASLESTSDVKDVSSKTSEPANPDIADKADATAAAAAAAAAPDAKKATNGFANASVVSPFGSLAAKNDSKDAPKTQPQTSASAFAASGFASMASSASPFGGGTTATTKTKDEAPSQLSGFATAGQTKSFGQSNLNGSNGFASAGATLSGFGALPAKTFGNGFGSGLGGGSKLSSFAAPVGDTKFGNETKAKPFGAADDSGSDNEGSEGASDTGAEDQPEAADDLANVKYNLQETTTTGEEDEDTIILTRGKLFRFNQERKAWAERGVGPIKLNVKRPRQSEEPNNPPAANGDADSNETDPCDSATKPSSSTSLPPTARILMRAAATHRLLLNAPIFKEMPIGDQNGQAPAGKQLYFTVPEQGRGVQYIIRMGKEDDIRALHRAVNELQTKM